jgi:competence protein ComEA
MTRSLSLKLGMLAVTLGVVFWIRLQPIEHQPNDAGSKANPLVVNDVSNAETLVKTNPIPQAASGPTSGTPGGTNRVALAGRAGSRLLDLNSATVSELESLPGIGAVLAQRVIAYRASVGRFLVVEDLREVKGIGAKTFDRIKSLVTVARDEQKSKTEKRPS